MHKSEQDRFLTVNEASQFLNISKSHLYKLIHFKKISHFKPNGKLVYFDKIDLLDYIKQNRINSEREIEQLAINHTALNQRGAK
ncbi:MAG: helix-turn-helix domain-containing protein [Melioribacteraceae bacterium]|nr:helix-turn-helix domain-containing protein [Melioribacteraceae bacterium]